MSNERPIRRTAPRNNSQELSRGAQRAGAGNGAQRAAGNGAGNAQGNARGNAQGNAQRTNSVSFQGQNGAQRQSRQTAAQHANSVRLQGQNGAQRQARGQAQGQAAASQQFAFQKAAVHQQNSMSLQGQQKPQGQTQQAAAQQAQAQRANSVSLQGRGRHAAAAQTAVQPQGQARPQQAAPQQVQGQPQGQAQQAAAQQAQAQRANSVSFQNQQKAQGQNQAQPQQAAQTNRSSDMQIAVASTGRAAAAERAARRAANRPTRRKENRLSKGMRIAIVCCIVLVCAAAGAGAFVYMNVSQSQTSAQTDRNDAQMDHADKSVGAVAVADVAATGNGELVAQGAFDPNDSRLTTLKEMLDAYPKEIGMVIYSCDGSKALSYNSTGEFFSACTVKMAFMYYVSQQLEAGNGTLDELMTYMPYHYHTGSGDIKYQSMYTDYSIRDLIWYLLTISDNIAYEMLRSRYGYDGQNQLMESIGSYSLMTGDALWAYAAQPKDYLAVWMYYYNYFLSDSEVAKVMYDACTNTDYNYATETLTQYNYSHKSGDNFEPLAAYNDTGILWCDNPYIYIVLTSSDLFGDYAQEENEIMELVNELFR